jgi:predicted molibdopterin-dependent oxidoreductase YjgC
MGSGSSDQNHRFGDSRRAFATFHTSDVFLKYLTGQHRDKFVHTPEYKLTAVGKSTESLRQLSVPLIPNTRLPNAILAPSRRSSSR